MTRDFNQHDGSSPVTGDEIAHALQISDDEAMATAFKRGDRDAYHVIYRRYEARVEGVCRRMLRDGEDAREATQETFLRVYQGLGRFNGRYQLGAWIARIAMNVCLDHIRSRKRRPVMSLVDEVPEAKLRTFENGPEDALLSSTESQLVRETLASLPDLHRAAMVLREYEGLSYAEIAEALAISDAQVKALLHRARSRFRKSWERAAVSALLPWRIFQRVRARASHDNAVGSSLPHVADSVGSSTQWVTTCATAIQSCAPAIGERAAVIFTALAVGAATTSGAAPARPHENTRVTAVHRAEARELRGAPPGHHGAAPAKRRSTAVEPKDQDVDTVSQPDTAPVPPPPPPSDEDTTSSGGNEPDDEDMGGRPTPSVTPTPAPPAPTMVSVAFEQGQTTTPVAPKSNDVSLDCAANTLDQTVATTLTHNGVDYPVLVDLQISTRTDMTMTVTTPSGDIVYGGGAPGAFWEVDPKRGKLGAQGPYSWVSGVDPHAAGMTRYGRFMFALVLDCGASSVITESLRFTVG